MVTSIKHNSVSIYKYIILSIFISLMTVTPCIAQHNMEWVVALEDSEIIFANGIRAELKKGSKLKHPSRINGRDISVILMGEARFEVLKGYRFTVVYNEITIKATGAGFSIRKGKETIEVTVFNSQVSISTGEQEIILRAFKKATYNIPAKQFSIVDTRIKRT